MKKKRVYEVESLMPIPVDGPANGLKAVFYHKEDESIDSNKVLAFAVATYWKPINGASGETQHRAVVGIILDTGRLCVAENFNNFLRYAEEDEYGLLDEEELLAQAK